MMMAMLRQLDTHGDGVIRPNEIDPVRRTMFDRMCRRAGIDPSGPVTLSALQEGLQRAMQNRQAGGLASGSRQSSNAPAGKPLVPGFGTPNADKPISIAGFGTSIDMKSTIAPTSSSSSGSSASSSASASAVKRGFRLPTAQERLPLGLPPWFRERDLNQDGQLTMAEYCEGEPSNAKAAEFAKWDLNNDGIITPDEVLKASNAPTRIAAGPEKEKTVGSAGESGSKGPRGKGSRSKEVAASDDFSSGFGGW